MKRIIIFVVLIVLIAAAILAYNVTKAAKDYNSLSSKNTRAIENILTQNTIAEKFKASGYAKDLIHFDYDKVYVFEAYQSIESMEAEIGFHYPKLQEALSEGMNNILFVKDNLPVAYLFGYPSNIGYYIDMPVGEYMKSQVDKMTYTVKKSEAGNSSSEPLSILHYEFK